jgi:hypothetical protein
MRGSECGNIGGMGGVRCLPFLFVTGTIPFHPCRGPVQFLPLGVNFPFG